MKFLAEITGEPIEAKLSQASEEALIEIAARCNLSLPTALEQAIADAFFIMDQEASGGKLLIKRGDKLHFIERRSTRLVDLCPRCGFAMWVAHEICPRCLKKLGDE